MFWFNKSLLKNRSYIDACCLVVKMLISKFSLIVQARKSTDQYLASFLRSWANINKNIIVSETIRSLFRYQSSLKETSIKKVMWISKFFFIMSNGMIICHSWYFKHRLFDQQNSLFEISNNLTKLTHLIWINKIVILKVAVKLTTLHTKICILILNEFSYVITWVPITRRTFK